MSLIQIAGANHRNFVRVADDLDNVDTIVVDVLTEQWDDAVAQIAFKLRSQCRLAGLEIITSSFDQAEEWRSFTFLSVLYLTERLSFKCFGAFLCHRSGSSAGIIAGRSHITYTPLVDGEGQLHTVCTRQHDARG